MQCKSETGPTSRCAQPAWYKAYFDAMVERDRSQALLEIERARHAIENRTIELRQVAPSSPREAQDILHALTYLGILLMYMNSESGDLLWD